MSETREILNTHYESVSEVKPEIFRAEETFNGQPVEIHYFDSSDSIFDADFDIEEYQYSVLGKDYYSKPGPSQWSYYLNFLVPDDQKKLKQLEERLPGILRNRSLARKYVFTFSELRERLSEGPAKAAVDKQNPIDAWSAILAENQLEYILNLNVGVPDIADRIAKAFPSDGPMKLKRSTASADMKAPRGIDFISFVKYRPFPENTREFEFRKVNLICGENAVGKTSLLESLELAICGKTARNRDEVENFSFRLKFAGEDKPRTIRPESNTVYRNRDRAWYGRHYPSRNHLQESFARFNFFDTDAAIRFSDSSDTKSITKALSGLLFGNESQQFEKRIFNVKDELTKKRRLLGKELENAQESLRDVEVLLAGVKEQDQSSDGREVSADRLKAAGLKSEESLSIEDLASLFDTHELAISTVDSQEIFAVSSSLSEIQDFLSTAEERIGKLEKLEVEKRQLNAKLVKLINAQDRLFESASFARRASSYLESGAREIPTLELKLESLQQETSAMEAADEKLSHITLEPFSNIQDTGSALVESAGSKYEDANKSLVKLEAEFEKLKADSDEKRQLLKEITLTALEYVQHESSEDCPVCGVTHGHDELLAKIEERTARVSSLNEDEISKMSQDLDKRRRNAARFQEELQEIRRFLDVCVLAGLKQADPVAQLVVKLVEFKSGLVGRRDEIAEITSKIVQYERSGYSRIEIDSIQEQLGLTSPFWSGEYQKIELEESIKAEITELEIQITDTKDTIERNADETRSLVDSIGCLAIVFGEKEYLVNAVKSGTKVVDAVDELRDFLSFGQDNNLKAVVDTARDCQRLVGSLFQSRARTMRLATAEKQAIELGQEIQEIERSLTNIKPALELLTKITEEQSLDALMSSFLSSNEEQIRKIFLEIHSPPEFSDMRLSESQIVMVRRDGSEASPTSLSTGQRTALAISLFLVMNSALTNGPRLLLFDDPVAHVDDMNVLSFIDYLRKIAIEEDKQFFFATASQKVAALFSKKFAFMEDEFHPIELTREPYKHSLH